MQNKTSAARLPRRMLRRPVQETWAQGDTSVLRAVGLFALFASVHASGVRAEAQPTPAQALDAFLTTPRYRDPDEGERRDRDRAEVWHLESLERGDLDAKVCEGARWLLTGRLKRSGGARAAFEADAGLRDLSLIFYKVKTRVSPDLRGRYVQSRTPTPVARFTLSREQALALNNDRLGELLSGPGCVTQARALLNDLWIADEVAAERDAIAQLERARGVSVPPAPAPAPPP